MLKYFEVFASIRNVNPMRRLKKYPLTWTKGFSTVLIKQLWSIFFVCFFWNCNFLLGRRVAGKWHFVFAYWTLNILQRFLHWKTNKKVCLFFFLIKKRLFYFWWKMIFFCNKACFFNCPYESKQKLRKIWSNAFFKS